MHFLVNRTKGHPLTSKNHQPINLTCIKSMQKIQKNKMSQSVQANNTVPASETLSIFLLNALGDELCVGRIAKQLWFSQPEEDVFYGKLITFEKANSLWLSILENIGVSHGGWMDCTVECQSVCVLLGILWCLDQASLEVRAAAWGAAQQQVLLMDQAVEQVLLPVVVIHLQECHYCNPKPGEPSSPQTKLSKHIFFVNSGFW